MTFEDSVAILRRGARPGADGALEHRLAAVTYSHHHERHIDPCGRVRFHDAAPNVSGHEPPPLSEQWTEGGQRPGSAVGPTLLQELDGPVSAFVLLAHGDGKCGLYRVGSVTNALDPGETTVKDAEASIARAVRGLERMHNHPKAIAARDAAWTRQRMHEIAAANKKFWGLT